MQNSLERTSKALELLSADLPPTPILQHFRRIRSVASVRSSDSQLSCPREANHFLLPCCVFVFLLPLKYSCLQKPSETSPERGCFDTSRNTSALCTILHKSSLSPPGGTQIASPRTLCTDRSSPSAAAPTCVKVRVRVLIHLLVLQDVVRHLRPNGRLHVQPLQRHHSAGGLHAGGEPQAGQETGKKPKKTSAPFLGRNPPLQAAQPQADPQGQGTQGESG